MKLNLKIWRQSSDKKDGKLHDYRLENVDPNISFLEMLDILNNKLVKEKKDPVTGAIIQERQFFYMFSHREIYLEATKSPVYRP